MEVVSGASTETISARITGAGGNAIIARVDSTSSNLMQFFSSTSSVGSITTNGTTTAYNTTSDQRLKTNIIDASEATSDLLAVKVRSFDWKSDDSHQRYGMIAQELLEVAPDAVHVPENPDLMMGVDYSKLVPMMIKTIQELTARLAALEAK
jgi:plasmid maintenance system killer protein